MLICSINSLLFFFFFNDTATTEIYTLSLHDALPISSRRRSGRRGRRATRGSEHRRRVGGFGAAALAARDRDRKSTRLNSSHSQISYAVFCLKKKNITHTDNVPYEQHYATRSL